MVTITIDTAEELKKTHFWSFEQFTSYLFAQKKISPIDFWQLSEDEITPELLKKIEEAKKMDKSMFTNIGEM